MNVFLRELKSNRKSLITWTLSLSAIVVVFMTLYPAFTADVASTKKILANFPPAFRDALNLSLANFFTVFGFFAYLLTFVLLAGAVQAMNIGTGVLSREDTGKTTDFLLTKPISRSKVVTSKLLAALTNIVTTNVIFTGGSMAIATLVSKDSFSAQTFILLSLILLWVQLMFVFLGAFFSVILPRIKSVVSVSLPTVFTFYIIAMLGSVLGEEKIRYITPFKYFDTNYIIANGRYETKFLVIEAIFIVVSIIATYAIYLRRDVRATS